MYLLYWTQLKFTFLDGLHHQLKIAHVQTRRECLSSIREKPIIEDRVQFFMEMVLQLSLKLAKSRVVCIAGLAVEPTVVCLVTLHTVIVLQKYL